jgi:hypothetical protein
MARRGIGCIGGLPLPLVASSETYQVFGQGRSHRFPSESFEARQLRVFWSARRAQIIQDGR